MKKINKYKKPIIGISMDTGIKKTYSSYPWFAIRDDYINSIINSNGLPLMLPSKPGLVDHYFKLIDGILITGGDFDIDPKLYGEKKNKAVSCLDKTRTNFELKIAKLALKKNKPILGICGGQQLLNVALNGSVLNVDGPLGKKTLNIDTNLFDLKINDGKEISIKPKIIDQNTKRLWGMNRSLINNAIIGASKGYEKVLELTGVGYRAALKGNDLNLSLGFSHNVVYKIPKEVKVLVEKQTIIKLQSSDKQLDGKVASEIKSLKPVEPYKGKGIKESWQYILRKEGKKK